MANSDMAVDTARYVSEETTSYSSQEKIIDKYFRENLFFDTKWNSNFGGLEGFRKSLTAVGISERACRLISNSRKTGSISSYESAWRKWSSWCLEREIDIISCSINFKLDFLGKPYEKRLAHRTIMDIDRPFLYIMINPEASLWEIAIISNLWKSIFNNRAPQPRYTFIWHVDQVIALLKTLLPRKYFSDKEITLKPIHSSITCSKLTIETLEQGMKYVQR